MLRFHKFSVEDVILPGCYQYAEQIAVGVPHDRCVPGGSTP